MYGRKEKIQTDIPVRISISDVNRQAQADPNFENLRNYLI